MARYSKIVLMEKKEMSNNVRYQWDIHLNKPFFAVIHSSSGAPCSLVKPVMVSHLLPRAAIWPQEYGVGSVLGLGTMEIARV